MLSSVVNVSPDYQIGWDSFGWASVEFGWSCAHPSPCLATSLAVVFSVDSSRQLTVSTAEVCGNALLVSISSSFHVPVQVPIPVSELHHVYFIPISWNFNVKWESHIPTSTADLQSAVFWHWTKWTEWIFAP